MSTPTPGAWAERTLTVAEEHTATSLGSGPVQVFATAHMIALMEGAAVDAATPALEAGFQTVGTAVDVRHVAATPLGGLVRARAELVAVEGRKLVYRVEAHDEAGLIGEGTHERYIIEMSRFMQRARQRRA